MGENARHDAGDVGRRDGSVLFGAIGQVELALGGNRLRPHEKEILREEGRPNVHRADVGPIEDVLGEPVLTRERALGVSPGRDLGHVHECLDAGISSRHGDDRGGLDQQFTLRRIHEVEAPNALHRVLHGAEIEQVRDHYVSAEGFEARRARVSTTDERAHGKSSLEHLLDDP